MSSDVEIKNILIFDDDPDYRKLLVHSLNKILTDSNLEEYDPLEQGMPDDEFDWSKYNALILDYNLGVKGVTGLDVLYKHRNKDNFPATVMLTGAGNEEVTVRAMKAGVYDYLRKESLQSRSMQLLADALKEACEKHEAEYIRTHALEAARKVAKLEAKNIYSAYKAQFNELQQKEEARINAERLKLKDEMQKNRKLLKEIEKTKKRVELAKQEAQAELEKLEKKKKNPDPDMGEKTLQEKLKEAHAKLEERKMNVVKAEKEHEKVEDALSKSSWKLDQTKAFQDQLKADLEIFSEEDDETDKKKAPVKEEKTEMDSMLDDISSQLKSK